MGTNEMSRGIVHFFVGRNRVNIILPDVPPVVVPPPHSEFLPPDPQCLFGRILPYVDRLPRGHERPIRGVMVKRLYILQCFSIHIDIRSLRTE